MFRTLCYRKFNYLCNSWREKCTLKDMYCNMCLRINKAVRIETKTIYRSTIDSFIFTLH